MRYIVSRKTLNIDGYKVVGSVKEVGKDCKFLIYNKNVTNNDTEILEILKIKDSIEKKIYVSENPNVLFSTIFKSIGGVVCDNEEVLEDKELLDYMCDEGYEDCTIDSIILASKALDKCLADLLDVDTFEQKRLYKSGLWLQEIKTAVADIQSKLQGANEFSMAVIKTFNKLNIMLEEVNVSKEAVTKEMLELKKAMGELEREQKLLLEESKNPTVVDEKNTTRFRFKYTVPSTIKKVVYVKEYSECRYLTSFFLCYRDWVRAMLKKDFKIVLIIPDEYYLLKKYKDFPKLDELTVEFLHGSEYGVCTMTDIRKSVIDDVIKHSDVGVIFIDKTYDEKQLIDGTVVHKYGATGNISVLERNKLKPARTFMSITGVEGSMIIPHFENYAEQTNDTAKKAIYNACGDLYKELSNAWGV